MPARGGTPAAYVNGMGQGAMRRGSRGCPWAVLAVQICVLLMPAAMVAQPVADDAARFAVRHGGPAWTTPDGQWTETARHAIARLRLADRQGLDPADYAVADGPADAAGRAARDAALTRAVLRYMHDVHLGRVDPRRLGLALPAWDEPHDFVLLLHEALVGQELDAALERLAPPFPVYRALVDALAHYRELARQPWPPLPAITASVKPGQPYAGLAALRVRLGTLGDLASPSVLDGDRAGPLDAPTSAALARFQVRHGLTGDSVLGPRTLAALQVTPTARVAQIVLALERLRWTPDLGTRRVIAVNIPMFALATWEAGGLDGPPALTMDVIVGRAVRTQTPVFAARLDRVIFRPYWNVPWSIVRDEVLPAIRRDARYLTRQQMELVRGGGDDAPVVPGDAAGVAALARGEVRLRQRPGPHNALGLVKFVFPNDDSVYMHGTPAPVLFARDRRDFSHGCIRVEDPAGLAAWVLGDRGWTRPRVEAAMAEATNERVDLASPVDVVLFYLTAAVDPASGALHFADDVYGHDARLARALALPR